MRQFDQPKISLRRGASTIAICAALCIAQPAFAQEVEDDQDDRPQTAAGNLIIVSASRIPSEITELASQVTILGPEDLDTRVAVTSNLLDVLQFSVPGLGPADDSGIGCGSLRGRQIGIFIDGVPTADLLRQSSCNDLRTVSPFALERVEVNRGATAVFGSGTSGGVISTRFRRANSTELSVEAHAGYRFNLRGHDDRVFEAQGVDPDEFDDLSQNYYLGLGQIAGPFDYYVGGSYTNNGTPYRPDGQPVPFSFAQNSNYTFHGSVGLDLGRAGKLRLSGNYFREEPRIELTGDDAGSLDRSTRSDTLFPTPLRNPAVNEAFSRNILAALNYDVEEVLPNTDLSFTAFLQDRKEVSRRSFAYIYDGTLYNYLQADAFFDNRYGFRSGLTTTLSFGEREAQLSYGVDYQRNSAYRPVFDENDTDQIAGAFAPEATLDTLSFYGQAKVELTERLLLNAGVRHDRFSGEIGDRGIDEFVNTVVLVDNPDATDAEIFDDVIGAGFGDVGEITDSDVTLFNVGLVYEITNQAQVYAGFSQGTELSQLAREARRNENVEQLRLSPVKTNQYEVGFRHFGAHLRATLAGFIIRSDSAARLTRNPDDLQGPLINLRQPEEIKGLEATLDYEFTNEIEAGLNFTYQTGEAEIDEVVRPIQYDILSPTRIAGYLKYYAPNGIQARLDALHFFAGDAFTEEETAFGVDNLLRFNNTESYTLVDFTLVVPVYAQAKVLFGIDNLFNETYTPVQRASGIFVADASAPAEGRAFTVGLRWGF